MRLASAVLTLTLACGAALAAETQTSTLLDRFPAPNAAARDAACAELLRLGPAGLAGVLARVLPPGKGDDSKARFAANGLAVYVRRAGAETERVLVARSLLGALGRASDKDVAAFLISQLQLAGRQEAVRPLERYLTDERLASPAASALLAIGGDATSRAFLKALDRAPAKVRPTLVNALGEQRSRAAVRRLIALADDEDAVTRQAALAALANIGDPAAGAVLSRSRLAASHREREQAAVLYLRHARRLVESGRAAEGLAAARSVLANYQRPGEAQHASAALALIVAAGGERALPELIAAVDARERTLRGAALLLAEKIPGTAATARWVEKARGAPPDVRAAIVDMLGRRGDRTALPFVREGLGGRDEVVRLAAIPAGVRLDRDAVLPDLLKLLPTASAAESATLKAALLEYPASAVVPEAARLLDGAPPPARAVLVGVMAEKGAREAVEPAFRLTEEQDPAVREAAFAALGKVAGDEDIPRLAAMLDKASEGDDVVRLREAIAAAALRNPDPERRADRLLQLLQKAPPAGKVGLLRLLPRVGGARLLRAVAQEAENADPEVQTAAIGALARWPDYAASDELLRVAASAKSPQQVRAALQGFVRLVARSETPTFLKMEAFEKALALPVPDADRRSVLTGLGYVREPESLRLLARHLDDPGLREAASAALLNLASRQSPEERWLSGHEAYSVLRRVEASLTDAAAKERAARLIAERLKQGGFVPLFDGRSLDGWKGLVADPPKRANMSPEQLSRAQAEADARMREHWKAADGALVFDGKGDSLCTSRDYGDFEMLVDWRIEKGGDSGIYLRGSPQVQIWDAEANPVGSGGLYNNQKGKSQPTEKADRPVGEWNSFRIFMIADRVTVYLNDKRVVDNVVLENYWDRNIPIYPTGQIELQAHGNPLAFRNLYIREIPRDAAAAATPVSTLETGEGFVPLFNGRDLEGWTGNVQGYAAEDGRIVVHPERAGGNVYTAKEYTDFVLRFDFRLTPAANNGIGIRAPLQGDAAYVGMELQVLEDGSPVYWNLQPYQYHGSIYGVVPAKRGVLRAIGEWNSEEVTVKGRQVTVIVNGTTVVDADIDAASANGTLDHREHPGLSRASGHIGFLGHGSIVEFRNIRIREIR